MKLSFLGGLQGGCGDDLPSKISIHHGVNSFGDKGKVQPKILCNPEGHGPKKFAQMRKMVLNSISIVAKLTEF